MNRIDEQLLARTIKRRIDPTDELITRQDGHDVVPEPAFVFGGVDLALIAKVEEAGGSLAITDQIVKRREQGCPGLPFLMLQPFKHREQVCMHKPRAHQFLALLLNADPQDALFGFQFAQHFREAGVAVACEMLCDITWRGHTQGVQSPLGGSTNYLVLGKWLLCDPARWQAAF